MRRSVPETMHPAIWGLRLSKKYRPVGVRNMAVYLLMLLLQLTNCRRYKNDSCGIGELT